MANQEPARNRPALMEISTRTGVLPYHRMGTPSFNRRSNALNPALIDSPAANIPDSFLSPRMSPDEAVIQQRGRRRVPIIWSPEKSFQLSPQKTPTKCISAMTLRSSPRKRSLIKELSEVSVTGASIASPVKRVTPVKSSPTSTKRMRLEDASIHRNNQDLPLEMLLKGLSSDQLITIITGMTRNNPHLENTIRSELPMPDIAPLEEELNHLKKNIFKSLPASRLLSKTDSVAYSRAATHLVMFKKAIVDQSQILHNSKHWDALLEYVIMAWSYVRGTPVWENQAHNAVRKHCFKILSYHAISTLKQGSMSLKEELLIKFQQKLKLMTADCEDINDCVIYLSHLVE